MAKSHCIAKYANFVKVEKQTSSVFIFSTQGTVMRAQVSIKNTAIKYSYNQFQCRIRYKNLARETCLCKIAK